jgi:hypothetical protein
MVIGELIVGLVDSVRLNENIIENEVADQQAAGARRELKSEGRSEAGSARLLS